MTFSSYRKSTRRVLGGFGFICVLCMYIAGYKNSNAEQALQATTTAQAHAIITANDLHWGPLLPGSQMAVVSGDPSGSGPFVIRIKSTAGAIVPAHWHPKDENITLLEGAFSVGMGDNFDTTKLTTMHPGDFLIVPAAIHHFAKSDGSTVQVHGMGPFQVNFVNPADDPRSR